MVVYTFRPSGTWKRLLSIHEEAEANIRWSLASGFVEIWMDTWVGEEPLYKVVAIGMAKPHFLVVEFYE